MSRKRLGATTHHGKRVAALAGAMGLRLGMNGRELSAVTSCALMHDNALTEMILAERKGGNAGEAWRLHCESGQRNMEALIPASDISGHILYHHEFANGSGPFGKKEGEFPLGAELIGIADSIDAAHPLQNLPESELDGLLGPVSENKQGLYTKRSAEALVAVFDKNMLSLLRDDRIAETAERFIPAWEVDMEDEPIFNLAGFVTRIIDYKSEFTHRHSVQIANKAWLMGGYYQYAYEEKTKLYLAAALHDLGKLAIPVTILEKPGKLTRDEYKIIMGHAAKTRELLEGITGFEDIWKWASNHHEKLDGSGYPFGKTAEALDFNSRLMACIDIYQAVSEARPYHPPRSHEDTMPVLYRMSDEGLIDGYIASGLDKALAAYSLSDVPAPRCPLDTRHA
ncbi:MAG: HD domain-containing protein [Spirochaetaceae bacterium]|nr:HD domain-containing protein [Spirochaetaceae bacterium]